MTEQFWPVALSVVGKVLVRSDDPVALGIGYEHVGNSLSLEDGPWGLGRAESAQKGSQR